MPRIWLLARDGSDVAAEAARRVDEHFGAGIVQRWGPEAESQWRPGDVAVLVLERSPTEASGDPLWPREAEPFVSRRLAEREIVIPALAGGVVMPGPQEFPEPLRELSFMHALPLRTGVTMPRDVGRLIESLETQLRWIVGNAYPHDGWLLTVGALATLLGFTYSLVAWFEFMHWSFGHDNLFDFLRDRRWLFLAGPFSLGAGLAMLGAGRWWRQVREYGRLRAARLRQGAGEVPERPDGPAAAVLCTGLAAVGWGLPAASATVVAAVVAWGKRTEGAWKPQARRRLALGLAAAALGVAWTTPLWRRQHDLRHAVELVEESRVRVDAGASLESILEPLEEASRVAPWYGIAPLEEALAYLEFEENDKALAALDRAVPLFPIRSQGVFEPSHARINEAYMLRAELHDSRGDAELAERDRDLAQQVQPFMALFGGLLRFWNWWPAPQ